MVKYTKNYILIMCISFLICLSLIILTKDNTTSINYATENIKILANGIEVETFPSKQEGFIYEGITCVNGTTGTWDELSWSLTIDVKKAEGCIIYFYSIYKEPILNGADPILPDGLIPVTIDENGTIKIANPQEEWYDYETNKWANAAVVNDSQFRGNNYGKVIPTEAIEQMYVWIPRYQYDQTSIQNASNAIDITFVNKTEDAHPAFTFGTEELQGLWVGKFEQSEDGTIKPNQNSVSNLNVASLQTNVTNANNSNGLGIDSNIHMIKSTEWGAVAYLSQSQYGICEANGTCTEKVESNNHYNTTTWETITGCGSNDTSSSTTATGIEICPAENRWNSQQGKKASTNHNITGIYDMAAGKWEYTMSSMNNSSNNYYANSSGIPTQPESKYIDIYPYNTNDINYSTSLTGDAINELYSNNQNNADWNDDQAFVLNNTNSWMIKGGRANYGASSGIFATNNLGGGPANDITTRSVLAPISEYNFSYIGNYQTFTTPSEGTYQIELWGASTVIINNSGVTTGHYFGSYTSGDIYLNKGDILYIYNGEYGKKKDTTTTFNGGGSSSLGTYGSSSYPHYYQNYSGGGSTDIRLVSGTYNSTESLTSRLMVAGGAGTTNAGGLYSNRSYPSGEGVHYAYGASQILPGFNIHSTNLIGGFGYGGNGEVITAYYGSKGAGSGYYGGGGALSATYSADTDSRSGTGNSTGGSSYISGHTGSVAIESATQIQPNQIKIPFDVRYVEVGSQGSSANTGNHIVELQVYDQNGNNVALNKIPTINSTPNSTYPLSRITDGNTTSTVYASVGTITTLDLGQAYDISYVKLWRYYADSRYYKDTYIKLYNSDKTEFVYAHSSTTDGVYKETSTGKIFTGCNTGTSINECSIHYSGYTFTNSIMIDGSGYSWTNAIGEQMQMPNPEGGLYSIGTGHVGNGYTKITKIN